MMKLLCCFGVVTLCCSWSPLVKRVAIITPRISTDRLRLSMSILSIPQELVIHLLVHSFARLLMTNLCLRMSLERDTWICKCLRSHYNHQKGSNPCSSYYGRCRRTGHQAAVIIVLAFSKYYICLKLEFLPNKEEDRPFIL